MTIVKSLDAQMTAIGIAQRGTTSEAAKREFAIAKHHLEDAIMRVNRGFAFMGGVYQTADVEAEVRPNV